MMLIATPPFTEGVDGPDDDRPEPDHPNPTEAHPPAPAITHVPHGDSSLRSLGGRSVQFRLRWCLTDTLDLDRAVGDERGNCPRGGQPWRDERARYSHCQRKLDDCIRSLLDDDAPHVAFMDEPCDLLQEYAALGGDRFLPRLLGGFCHHWPPLLRRPTRAGFLFQSAPLVGLGLVPWPVGQASRPTSHSLSVSILATPALVMQEVQGDVGQALLDVERLLGREVN